MFLNAFVKPFSTVKLQQQCEKRNNEILEYLGNFTKRTIVGSIAEGLNDCTSDLDLIICDSTIVVIESTRENVNCNDPQILVVRIPDEKHPGYSKLRVKERSSFPVNMFEHVVFKDGIIYLKNSIKIDLIRPLVECMPYSSINGPAFHSESNDQHVRELIQDIGFETQQLLVNGNYHICADTVFCFESTRWPFEASEWIKRKRTPKWQKKELFENIINSGYLLAAVGSKESKDNELQWRVSFNKAELLIIESFNETQIHCIRLLKTLKNNCLSEIAGNNITSYTMKTVMFWCLDEKSDEFWQTSNLMFCFCFCLSKLKSFVENGFIPNYFIRDRNQYIASEYTFEIQQKTIQCLDKFLRNPKQCISVLYPSYKGSANTSISDLNLIGMNVFIQNWLDSQLELTLKYWFFNRALLLKLYDGYNIQNILFRCDMALKKLKTINYTQPLMANLRNYMGVLTYILLMEEHETGEHRTDSVTREKYSRYMKLSATGDLTHNTLRTATCYLDDCVKEDCLKTIRTVTESDESIFLQKHGQRLKQTVHCDIEDLRVKQLNDHEIVLYNRIIKNIDFIDQDPYKTTDEFELLKERGLELIGYNSLRLAWKQCYFDVTFMRAELPVLPKPAAVELCIDTNQTLVTYHPFLYGLLLEYLWHEKYGTGNKEKESVLEKMENCVSIIPDKQKSIGLNFMAYCYSLQKDNRAAFRCLIQSLKFNSIKTNVAYRYMKYKLEKLRE